MAGPVPAIHVFIHGRRAKDVDARDKRGHDGPESVERHGGQMNAVIRQFAASGTSWAGYACG